MLCSEDLETMIVVIVTKIGGKLGIVKTCLLHHKITYMTSAFSPTLFNTNCVQKIIFACYFDGAVIQLFYIYSVYFNYSKKVYLNDKSLIGNIVEVLF